MAFDGLRLRHSPMRAALAVALACGCVAAFEGCGLDVDGDQVGASDAGSVNDVQVDGLPTDASGDARPGDGEADDDADANPSDAIADGDAPPDACDVLESDCLDGIDNDCNGVADCADP